MLLHSEGFDTHSGAMQRERYYKTGEKGMSCTKSYRAVAGATGRRFKSSRPDVASRIGKVGYICTALG